jgi:hypothetical protein
MANIRMAKGHFRKWMPSRPIRGRKHDVPRTTRRQTNTRQPAIRMRSGGNYHQGHGREREPSLRRLSFQGMAVRNACSGVSAKTMTALAVWIVIPRQWRKNTKCVMSPSSNASCKRWPEHHFKRLTTASWLTTSSPVSPSGAVGLSPQSSRRWWRAATLQAPNSRHYAELVAVRT